MIDRDGAMMTLVCDTTGAHYRKTYHRDDFDMMLDDAKFDGWRIVKERGEWRHYSPQASRAENEFDIIEDFD
jgi:hypothetical protein